MLPVKCLNQSGVHFIVVSLTTCCSAASILAPMSQCIPPPYTHPQEKGHICLFDILGGKQNHMKSKYFATLEDRFTIWHYLFIFSCSYVKIASMT
jgi:hypothetical protein